MESAINRDCTVDVRHKDVDFQTSITPRYKIAGGCDFWVHQLRLARAIYRSDCATIVTLEDHRVGVVKWLADTVSESESEKFLAWLEHGFDQALAYSVNSESALIDDDWIGIRLRYFTTSPAVFLVVRHDTTTRDSKVDTAPLYRLELVARDFLNLNRSHRRLLRGYGQNTLRRSH